jgi:hypothetical protein
MPSRTKPIYEDDDNGSSRLAPPNPQRKRNSPTNGYHSASIGVWAVFVFWCCFVALDWMGTSEEAVRRDSAIVQGVVAQIAAARAVVGFVIAYAVTRVIALAERA